jgi:hypothetical protein
MFALRAPSYSITFPSREQLGFTHVRITCDGGLMPRLCFCRPTAARVDDLPGTAASGLTNRTRKIVRLRGAGSLSVSLSTKGPFDVRAESPDAHFTFIVDGVCHECLWGATEFLLPRLSWLHFTDATVDELAVDTDDPENFFAEFVAIASGHCVTINRSNCDMFLSICAALGNWKLPRQLSPTITIGNAADCILFGGDISEEVGFIASYFWEFAEGLSIISEIV